MNSKEQKLIIDSLLSSGEIFARCAGIISSEYFDPEYRKVIQFIKEYSDKYSTLPNFDLVNAKHDLEFKPRKITIPEVEAICDSVELFCKQKGLSLAVLASIDDIESGDFGAMKARIDAASSISLQKDMGVDMFENPQDYLISLIDTDIYYSTGIKHLDDNLDGGLARKQLTLFSANSGVGKSVMLSNLGVNYSLGHGMNVVYISLELAEPMIFKRNAFIMTGVNAKEWKEKISFMGSKINQIKKDGAGSFRIKRLPTGCNINDVRSYLKQYEIDYGYAPDVIIIDYLDLLSPNEGTKNLSISEQDKFKAEQYSQLLHDYNAIGISASQQNREALKATAPDQSVIAGGMTKVNTVDNFISLVMDSALRAKGEMMAFFLKTRSAGGVGKMVMLAFDAACLRISDHEKTGGMTKLADNIAKRKKLVESEKSTTAVLSESISGLPGLTPEITPTAKIDELLDNIDNGVNIEANERKRENIANLGKLAKGKKTKKVQSAADLMAEEERITQYGKGEVEQPPMMSDSGKTFTEEQQEFIESNGLSKECVEHIMTFMG